MINKSKLLHGHTAAVRRDPLTFDLDNDGIETVGISATSPVLFDHDADGVKTTAGWIKSDDALLVRDVNGNGTIDNGRELFGDATLKSNGQLAADGFDALANLDSNADGKITSADTAFTNLRLWCDLNQDGISQSGELYTLSSQGIVSINVANTDHLITLTDGNQLADLGSYTKADGTTGSVGEVSGNLADVNLASDTFHSQFTDSIPLSTQAQTLPDMQGAGQVRSLREAASLSPALASLLSDFAAATTVGGTYTLTSNVENGTLTNIVAYNLTGNALNNVLKGNTAANKLTGGDGNDVLNGLGGSDTLVGGMGDDTYTVDVLTDIVTENANEGTDLVNVAIATSGGTYTLATNVENATLTNTVAYNLTGNTQDNVLIGNGVANNIKGNDGNDTLNGGLGNDILTGGLGNDLFSFTSALSGTNIDTISDFLRGTDDIALHATIFTKLLNDTDLSDNLVVGGTGVKALDANDYLIFNSTTKALYYDADGSGAGAAVQFATLTNVTTVNASDFVVL